MNAVKIRYDEPMSRHASLKVGGRVDALVMTENEDQLDFPVLYAFGRDGIVGTKVTENPDIYATW